MLEWYSCQICYPIEIKLLLLLLFKKNKRSNVLNMSLYFNFSQAVGHVYYYFKTAPQRPLNDQIFDESTL